MRRAEPAEREGAAPPLPPGSREPAWWLLSAALGGLLLAIAAIGAISIVTNDRAQRITQDAVTYDLEIEDEGDDLRAAVLDLRHYHRNIVFGGPLPGAREDLQRAYDALHEEINELEEVGVERLAAQAVPQPDQLREMAEAYYGRFWPAIELYRTDRSAFDMASAEGLDLIEDLEEAAEAIDAIGEELAAESLARIERETARERLLLYVVLGGVVLVSIVLAAATSRMLRRLRLAYDAEQRATQELSRALQSKTDFITDASHELRTPLTVIRGNAEIGLGTPGQPIHREVLADIAAEATRMSRLVDDLLFLARSDAGAAPLERELLPARRLLERLHKPTEVLARQHGARLVTEFAAEGWLEVDPARIEQAVLILVDNAGKHSPQGGRITFAARSRHGQLVISVADQGPGIPADELPLIFDRFYQVGKRRTRKRGGAGLGLSIARSIVEGHSGSIGAASSPERGTRMTIVLPLIGLPEGAVRSGDGAAVFRSAGDAAANGDPQRAAAATDGDAGQVAGDPLPSPAARRR